VDRTKVKKHRMVLGKKVSCRKDKEAMEQTGEFPVLQVFKNRLEVHEITKYSYSYETCLKTGR